MNKAIATIGFALVGLTASAQWESGSMLATGNLGFSSGGSEVETGNNTTGQYNESNFYINLKGGYFVEDNIAAGLSLGYSNNVYDNELTTNVSTTSIFSIGAFGRYYKPVANNFSLFGELAVDFGTGGNTVENTTLNTTSEQDISQFGVGLGLGTAYSISESLFLEVNYGLLGYNSSTYTNNPGETNESTTSYDSFGLNLDLTSLTFGVGFLF